MEEILPVFRMARGWCAAHCHGSCCCWARPNLSGVPAQPSPCHRLQPVAALHLSQHRVPPPHVKQTSPWCSAYWDFPFHCCHDVFGNWPFFYSSFRQTIYCKWFLFLYPKAPIWVRLAPSFSFQRHCKMVALCALLFTSYANVSVCVCVCVIQFLLLSAAASASSPSSSNRRLLSRLRLGYSHQHKRISMRKYICSKSHTFTHTHNQDISSKVEGTIKFNVDDAREICSSFDFQFLQHLCFFAQIRI